MGYGNGLQDYLQNTRENKSARITAIILTKLDGGRILALFCGEVRHNQMMQLPSPPLVDMPTARNLLLSSGVADACAEALKCSIDNWGQTPPILRVADDDGAARGMGVYKLWNHHVRTLLFNCKAIVFYEKSRHPFFGVARQLGIRVKHVDDHYRSQMNDTEQARQLAAQLPLKGFSGPYLTQLECGYRLDLSGTLVEKVAFICRKDRTIVWLWQIWGVPDTHFGHVLSGGYLTVTGPPVYAYDDLSR